jgi:hypothetical protein
VQWQNTLYMTFIDFAKAFDSINRKVMWQTLVEYQLPTTINIIKEMYEGYEYQILQEGKLTEPIRINSGVIQGYILSPTLFLLELDGVMRKVMEKRKKGIQWGLPDILEDLDFADDTCLLSQRYRDMETKLIKLQKDAEDAGLQINVNKTKEMRINSNIEHSLSINGKDIEQVESFLYLGSMVTKDGGAKEDVRKRIRKVKGAFVQLYPVWKNRNISRKTKLKTL